MPKLDLDNLFSYHAPKGNQVERYGEIREAAQSFAQVIVDLIPESAEQTLAIRKVHEAMMQANSAIACNENAVRNYENDELDQSLDQSLKKCRRTIINIVKEDLENGRRRV